MDTDTRHSTLDTQRPTLNWDAGGAEHQMAFGYLHGEPMAAVFAGENADPVAFVPWMVLVVAAQQGWEDTPEVLCPSAEEEGVQS